jgi:uncharacterized protein YrzB (UPF0473 family)
MELPSEVLIYVQNVRKYFASNEEARNYFIGDSDEEVFFKHLTEISQKNFEKDGEVMLNKEQFELLRRTVLAIEVIKDEETTNQEDLIFVDIRGFGKICLN